MRAVMFVGFALLFHMPLAVFAGEADLQPAASESLARAAQLRGAGDSAGALRAYIAAVDADPAAADLGLIRRYGLREGGIIIPNRDLAAAAKAEERWKEARALHVAALRQYLKLRPNDRDAVADLTFFLEPGEGVTLLDAALEKHPQDALLYARRGMLHRDAGRIEQSLADYERSATLDPDPARFTSIAVVATGYAANHPGLSADEKRALLARAMTALDRAEKVRPNSAETASYRSTALREQAKLEDDPAKRSALEAEADRLKALSANVWIPFASPASPPARAGNEEKAVVLSRVAPVYPEEAIKARTTGLVILEVVIDASGRVTQTKVIKPLPNGLSAAAEAAVRQWTFRPATRNGEPVEVTQMLTVNMKLPAE